LAGAPEQAEANKAVDSTNPSSSFPTFHSGFSMIITTPMIKRSYASVKKTMPEMNMIFQ
jgi:hypothetical protein